MQHPLAVETEGGRSGRSLPETLLVADRDVRAVDRLQAMGPGGQQDRHMDVVVRVGRVPGRLGAHLEGGHPDRGHEVSWAEDQALQPRRGLRDRSHRQRSPGFLDLHLEPDPTRLQAVQLFQLREHQVGRHHLLRAGHLRHDHRIQVGPGAGDYLAQIGHRPGGGPVVNPNRHQPGPPSLPGGQRRHHPSPGLLFSWRGHRILQVEEDRVHLQPAGLGDEAVGGTGDRENRTTWMCDHPRDSRTHGRALGKSTD